MKSYLSHLIEDMRKAAENLPPKPYYDIPPESEGIEYLIEWENAEPKPMQEWIGIDKANFPPAKKLKTEELELMVEEIIKLWQAYNFEAILPENLPSDIAYKVLINYFDKPVAWISEGSIGIEFCGYDPENCPYPDEFCTCKDLEDDNESPVSMDNADEIAILDEELKEIYEKTPEHKIYKSKVEQYVNQLIEDLDNAAVKINSEPKIPDNVDIRSAVSVNELIENPFLTI